MSTLRTYNLDTGDTTNLVIKTNGTTALTVSGSTQGITLGGALQPGTSLAAGTASLAPLDFAAGTNLTTAASGAIEYDGKVFYATPQGTQRGIIPGAQFYRLNADLAGANVTTAQNILGAGVTLSAGTVYAFESVFILTKTAGANSHTVGLGFGGTATINNYQVTINGGYSNNALPVGVANNVSSYSNSLSNVNVTNNIASATTSLSAVIKGTVSVNAGGTFIPQYTLSAAPGGAYTTLAGSYFLIYPIGAAGADTSVGTWA